MATRFDPYRESGAQQIRRLTGNLLESATYLTHAWRAYRAHVPGLHMQLVDLERRAADLRGALDELDKIKDGK